MEPSRRASRSFPSGRMLEAQRTFQSVVKQELQLLLTRGTKREVAVKLLLRRIVQSTEPPDAAAVRNVMRQFQMNYDDAVRALIVKQELGRLKRQGLDSLAAIEELTRKMKQQEEESVQDEKQTVEEDRDKKEEEDKTQETEVEAVQDKTLPDKDVQESSLSLIQRIGQVSISSGNTPDKKTEEDSTVQDLKQDTDTEAADDKEEDKTEPFSTPARTRSPKTGDVADLTPQTRKRRAAFEIQIETSSRSGPRSVQPLFPSVKKQKRCAEVGDGFLQVVTRKSKPTSSALSKSASPTGATNSSHNGDGGGGATRGEATTKNVHKRQRASPTGMQDDDESPVAENLRVSHVHHRHHHGHHHSKRHKSSSTH
ncbi:hypothetical protein PHYBOEH_003712 [Phytophthora boehmeriae]|uniref:Uncharacterized protein n=1 Tax=Phytophthora boehmeriae TaxID=109152 RepID=A0A8T1WN85_9STRA|nr:hypothetical protein PHYBOEH_003712 [Phytophthora boehmeriae]